MLKRLALTWALILIPLKGVGAQTDKSYYCIQLLSSKEITERERELFKELNREFKGVRLEKIGRYYTLRIGFWKEIGEARRALNRLRKKGFKGAFLRKCYYLPKRWVLPKQTEKPRPSPKRRVRENPKEQERISQLIESLLKENTKREVGEEGGREVKFPESRKEGKKEKGVEFSFGTSVNRELSKSYSFTALYYRGAGLRLIRSGDKTELGVAIRELSKEFWLKDTLLLKLGILRRENPLESWSPLSAEALGDFVDKKLSLSASYQAFRNYENQIDLKGLLSLRGGLTYHFSNSSGVELTYLYDRFTKEKELPFSTGSRFNLKGWSGSFSAFASVRGSSYLLRLGGKVKDLNLNFFTDSSLSMPPQSKGELYTDGKTPFFALDPMNLTGAEFKLSLKEFSLSSSLYGVNGKGKTILIGKRKLKSRGRFAGVSLFLKYSLTSPRKKLSLGGGLFFPGNAFEERKPKAGGYLDVKVSW
ncbi:SPOR domain-containing protein [Thermovibrio sp.]